MAIRTDYPACLLRSVFLPMIVLLVVGLCSSVSASASGLSPWWHVSVSAEPTRIQPGSGADEIQEVTVTGDSGQVGLKDPENEEEEDDEEHHGGEEDDDGDEGYSEEGLGITRSISNTLSTEPVGLSARLTAGLARWRLHRALSKLLS